VVLTNTNIDTLKFFLKQALLDEWRRQGHFESGKIVEEIDYEIERDFGRTSLIAKMYPYGIYIEKGVAAANIPFSPGSGVRKSKYIAALMSYAARRITGGDLVRAKSVAFAIAHKQKREGMPTRGSYRFSSTGKRTGWINDALEKNKDKIGEYVRQFYREFMTAEMESVLNRNIKAV